jgi:hypothetical protein
MPQPTKKTLKPKVNHRHSWDLAEDVCWSCGAYVEYCREQDCYASRYCKAKGKKFIEK